MKTIEDILSRCEVCPRKCRADRNVTVGRCGAGRILEVSKIMLHHWEEPCISGTDENRGSGAVFLTHCPLGCVYCQNRDISLPSSVGKKYTEEDLAEEFIRLWHSGAYNINLVSPTQYTPQLIRAVEIARSRGLTIPIVWNTGGYERPEMIEKLHGTVDVFLCDLKYSDPSTAEMYSSACDYPEMAEESLSRMIEQVGGCEFDSDGIMKRGVIVRHLVLPGERNQSIAILEKMAKNGWTSKILLALMAQYTPEFLPDKESGADRFAKIRRRITSFEYDSVASAARKLGFEGYFQSRASATKKYTPVF